MIHPFFDLDGAEAKGLLYGLLEVDQAQIRKHPEWPSMRTLIREGKVRYDARDPQEHWKSTREIMDEVAKNGVSYSDCEDLAPAVAADDRVRYGVQSLPFAYAPRQGLFHVVTAVPVGSSDRFGGQSIWPIAQRAPKVPGYVLQDPSAAAGMPTAAIEEYGTSAIGRMFQSPGGQLKGLNKAIDALVEKGTETEKQKARLARLMALRDELLEKQGVKKLDKAEKKALKSDSFGRFQAGAVDRFGSEEHLEHMGYKSPPTDFFGGLFGRASIPSTFSGSGAGPSPAPGRWPRFSGSELRSGSRPSSTQARPAPRPPVEVRPAARQPVAHEAVDGPILSTSDLGFPSEDPLADGDAPFRLGTLEDGVLGQQFDLDSLEDPGLDSDPEPGFGFEVPFGAR